MLFVTFGVWIPQARAILKIRDEEKGHNMIKIVTRLSHKHI
jgi:hypothetical protein